MKPRWSLHLVTLALLATWVPASASAYIDPGTGSMLVQSLLGAIAAALVFGRSLWRAVSHRLRRLLGRKDESPPTEGSEPPER
jgi:hypothetical protein